MLKMLGTKGLFHPWPYAERLVRFGGVGRFVPNLLSIRRQAHPNAGCECVARATTAALAMPSRR